MSLHRNPPFRAEHLGSLLRTDELLNTKTAYEAGKVPESDLVAVENKDIQNIVETQKKLGYPAVSDGEYRRHSMLFPGFIPVASADSVSVLGLFLPRS